MDGNPHHTIGYRLSGESRMQVYEGWSPFYELNGLQLWEQSISIAECKGLALVIFAKIEK